MSVKEKYQSVLDLGERLNVQNGKVEEENGVLRMWGTVNSNYEKDQLWDAIKEAGGSVPTDIAADIQVTDPSIYTRHTVVKGDSLSKIAAHYYGKEKMMEYKKIFEANRNILSNENEIEVGQDLVIPNL